MNARTHIDTHAESGRDHEILQTVRLMSQQFMQCHQFLGKNTHALSELLREAEFRGILLHEVFALCDVGYWLQHIDWQTKFLQAVLAFAQAPNRISLRPIIELYGRDRDRMRAEVEALKRQLEHRVAMFAKPDDALVQKAVTKNQRRVLAAHLHARSGYGGADLARFFGVPRTTAYGWLDWFRSLPDGLKAGILAFLDSQTADMSACPMSDPASSPVCNR